MFNKVPQNGAFKNAVQHTPVVSTTHNGGKTYQSSTDPVVDLFFMIGASRGKNINGAFEKALQYDMERTLRMLFWVRDIRFGAGERHTFRSLLQYLESNHPSTIEKLIGLVPEYGRWDDLLVFQNGLTKSVAYNVIKKALLTDRNALCAKWMPRKGKIASELRGFMDLSPKMYRKTLVNLSKTVETQMCAKQWGEINYSHVPSVAAARYQKAFSKNDKERYAAYREALNSKDPIVRATAKINASSIFPHDVLKSVFRGDAQVAKAQWDALPNYLGDSRIIPVVDVSGSMTSSIHCSSVRPIDISVSLGLYCADKQTGAFKDMFMTFSGRPSLEILRGDILSKINQLQRAHWEMNTNIEAALKEILGVAVKNNVPKEEMPNVLLIMSDMEFDRCVSGDTIFATAKKNFKHYGYELPKIVFWNLNARAGNNPVTFKENGAALVSGYSPSILKSILKGDFNEFTPQAVMDATIMSQRYDAIAEALKN